MAPLPLKHQLVQLGAAIDKLESERNAAVDDRYEAYALLARAKGNQHRGRFWLGAGAAVLAVMFTRGLYVSYIMAGTASHENMISRLVVSAFILLAIVGCVSAGLKRWEET